MMWKLDWLSIAKFGSDSDRDALMARLRRPDDRFGDNLIPNSIKGFFAEMVVEAWLDDFVDRHYWPSPTNDLVYEIGDGDHPVGGPDGIFVFEGTNSYDIKSIKAPKVGPHGELGFPNSHHAKYILWLHDHTITMLRRCPEHDQWYSRNITEYYDKIADYDALLYENHVTHQLQKRFEELTNDIQHI
jgi:hypothetical protein